LFTEFQDGGSANEIISFIRVELNIYNEYDVGQIGAFMVTADPFAILFY